MKAKIVKNVVIQSSIFNILLIGSFIFVGLNYTYPNFLKIEKLKNKLELSREEYKNIEKNGISFKKFKSLHTIIGKSSLKGNIYMNNILKEFSKNNYDTNFLVNSIEGKKFTSYSSFLNFKESEINRKKIEFEKQGANKEIEKIIPYYTDDASLDEDSLTDFKFINYIENLLDRFDLKFSNEIGVSNLVLAEGFNSSGKKGKTNFLNSKIYYFPLELKLEGNKKDILDFIFYIENVGKVNYNDGKVTILKNVSNLNLDNSSFNDLGDKFYPEMKYFNNLLFDISKISFGNYFDSSGEKIPEEYILDNNIWGYIKKFQGSEKMIVNLNLRFYVKGMPVFKMKSSIESTLNVYSNLIKVGKIGNGYILKNKDKLRNFSEIRAMRNFKKYNSYLIGLKNKINSIKKNSKKINSIGEVYKLSLEYEKIFNNINDIFNRDLKILSEKLFKKNKKFLIIKNN